MNFRIDEELEVLEGTPRVLDALLRAKSAPWLQCRKGADTFSPTDVLGHLIFGEITDWIPRARIILQGTGERRFEPFDRLGHREMIEGKSIGELLDWFRTARQKSLRELRGFALDDAKLQMTGTHPELGTVTLRNLLATWVVHDLGHIAQIMRVMSSRYTEEVGVWREYLSILR